MNTSSHTRYFILALILLLGAGRMRNSCKWCQIALMSAFGVLIILGIISYIKNENRRKRMKKYE